MFIHVIMVTLDISSLLYNKYTTAERTKTIHRKQNATSREVQHSNIRFLTPPPPPFFYDDISNMFVILFLGAIALVSLQTGHHFR